MTKLSNLPPGVTDRMIEEQAGAYDRTWTPIKTIRSHAGLARWLAECSEDPIGEIERPNIPSPYHFSPAVAVYEWNSRPVFWREESHKVYRVYAVPNPQWIFPLGTF